MIYSQLTKVLMCISLHSFPPLKHHIEHLGNVLYILILSCLKDRFLSLFACLFVCWRNEKNFPVNIAVLEQYRPSTEVIAGMVPVHHCFTATFITVIYGFAHRHFTGLVLVNCYPTSISRHNYITLPASYM